MHIVFACEWYYPSVGGVQEVVRQIGERLVARGHRVSVATSFIEARREVIHNGVHVVPFNVSGNAVEGLRGDVDGYRRFILAGDYDLLVIKAAQQWTFDALLPVLGAIVRPKAFIPCGFGALFDPDFADYYEGMRSWLKAFDRLIFYSETYRDVEFARANGIAALSFVTNGASEREFSCERDTGFRRRHGISPDAFLLLTVGTINGAKGHREVAEAFARADLSPRPAALILNGNQPSARSLAHRTGQLGQLARNALRPHGMRRAIRRLARIASSRASRPRMLPSFGMRALETLPELAARIARDQPSKQILLTDLPRAELIQAFLNSDLFVFASHVEYSPLVLFECAAAGLPFVSVPVGNAAEIAQWTGCGLICPAPIGETGLVQPDPAILAAAIEDLARDAPRRIALGATGRENWRKSYTWDIIARQYEEIFEDIVGGAGLDPRSTALSA
jgi:glycosyltransferase involved in cell wall biosynthesis